MQDQIEAPRTYVERIVPSGEGWDMEYELHRKRYDFAARYCAGKRVLDAACGSGYGSAMLMRAGASSVFGIDVSEEAIRYATANFRMPKLDFLLWDCENLAALQAEFEVMVSFETIEHLSDPARFVYGVSQVLANGGMFLCSTPNKRWSGQFNNPYHVSEMYLEEFESLLGEYFRIIERYYEGKTRAYHRYVQLLQYADALTSSRAYRALELLRVALGRKRMLPRRSSFRPDPVDGDVKIEPLDKDAPNQEYYIFCCTPK